MDKEKLIQAIREAKQRAKKRNFLESVDITINFRGIDFKKPENRIEEAVLLPHGRGKEVRVCVFASKALAPELKKMGIDVVSEEELQSMEKKDMKKLARKYHFFLAEAPLMPLIGRKFGPVLAPRKKMPKPVPPDPKAIKALVERYKKTVVVSNKKGKNMPVVHAPIGSVDMDDEKIAENALAVYNAILSKVSQANIRSVYVKTTMGPAVRVV